TMERRQSSCSLWLAAMFAIMPSTSDLVIGFPVPPAGAVDATVPGAAVLPGAAAGPAGAAGFADVPTAPDGPGAEAALLCPKMAPAILLKIPMAYLLT